MHSSSIILVNRSKTILNRCYLDLAFPFTRILDTSFFLIAYICWRHASTLFVTSFAAFAVIFNTTTENRTRNRCLQQFHQTHICTFILPQNSLCLHSFAAAIYTICKQSLRASFHVFGVTILKCGPPRPTWSRLCTEIVYMRLWLYYPKI